MFPGDVVGYPSVGSVFPSFGGVVRSTSGIHPVVRHGAVVAILLLAAWLRLDRLDLMEFKADEAGALCLTHEVLDGGGLPVRGLDSSVGLTNPPLFIDLLVLPGLVSRNPVHAAAFLACLNVAAVWLCFVFGRRIFGDRAALLAALLFAASPWAVVYSRKIWAQDAMALFSVGVLGGLHRICTGKSRRWFVPTACLCLVLPGLHFSGLWAPVVFVLACLRFRPRVGWKSWSLVGAVGLLLHGPYLAATWPPGNTHFGFSPSGFSVLPFLHAAQNLGAFGFHRLLGASDAGFPALVQPGTALLHAAVAAGFVAGFFFLVLAVLRPWLPGAITNVENLDRAGGEILLLWTGIPTVGFTLLSVFLPVHPHYLVMLYPAQFWLAAFAADRLGARWRGIGFALMVGAAAFGVIFLQCFFHRIEQAGGTEGDYGVAYRHRLAAAAYVATAGGRVVASSDGETYDYLVGALRRASVFPAPQFLILEWDRSPVVPLTPEAFLEEKRFGPVRVIKLRPGAAGPGPRSRPRPGSRPHRR